MGRGLRERKSKVGMDVEIEELRRMASGWKGGGGKYWEERESGGEEEMRNRKERRWKKERRMRKGWERE